MSSIATALVTELSPKERLEVLFDEVAELTGQRNAIDGRLVEIVAEIEKRDLVGMTGARSLPALVAWKTGISSTNAKTITTVARRLAEFPRCAAGMREGRLSLDQVGVIATGAADGSDEHYAELAASATVNQLRDAVKLEPRPDPTPEPGPEPGPRPETPRSITTTTDDESTTYHITVPHAEAATVDAAVQSHHDALIAQWKREHADGDGVGGQTPPFPSRVDGFMSLVEAGWDVEVARRPHGQRTTVVVHLDVEQRTAALHLGPVLSDSDRRYLTCDATCEVWLERHGRVIGSGRETRLVNRRLRRALEHRDRCCAVPGAGPPAGCTPTTSGIGRTAARPSWPTWCWCARTTTGCTTAASSPSPAPPTTSSSPTPTAHPCARDPWPAHRPHPRPRSNPVAGRPVNAPIGGGTNRSNPNHHRRSTSHTSRRSCTTSAVKQAETEPNTSLARRRSRFLSVGIENETGDTQCDCGDLFSAQELVRSPSANDEIELAS